jgi:hypothetical protein
MQVTRKVGAVTFEHHDEFKGEVTIRRGDASVSVPVEALRLLVAESVRFELAAHIAKMKPADLLRRIA